MKSEDFKLDTNVAPCKSCKHHYTDYCDQTACYELNDKYEVWPFFKLAELVPQDELDKEIAEMFIDGRICKICEFLLRHPETENCRECSIKYCGGFKLVGRLREAVEL